VAEVECDPETGRVDVKKIWVAHDCGRALNPVTVEGQMEGSAYMGFAEALMESHDFKPAAPGHGPGLHHGPSLLDYRIPTSLDTPELESIIVESVDPEGPYGAKEAGEGPLHPSIPAIANAIYDALGIRCDALPFDPPRIVRLLAGTDAKAAWTKARSQVSATSGAPAPAGARSGGAGGGASCLPCRASSGWPPERWTSWSPISPPTRARASSWQAGPTPFPTSSIASTNPVISFTSKGFRGWISCGTRPTGCTWVRW
jgi:hypothetical protein